MAAKKIDIAREMLRLSDAQEDFSALLTDDFKLFFPKWGVARGKEELSRFASDFSLYLKKQDHDFDSLEFFEQGNKLCLEGWSAGELVDGRCWVPDGAITGRFCTILEFRGNLIACMRIYLDPDYANATLDRYPWAASAKEMT